MRSTSLAADDVTHVRLIELDDISILGWQGRPFDGSFRTSQFVPGVTKRALVSVAEGGLTLGSGPLLLATSAALDPGSDFHWGILNCLSRGYLRVMRVAGPGPPVDSLQVTAQGRAMLRAIASQSAASA